MFSAVSAEDMQTARVITALTIAAFLGVRFVPGLSPYSYWIRVALAALYLTASVLFVGWVLLR